MSCFSLISQGADYGGSKLPAKYSLITSSTLALSSVPRLSECVPDGLQQRRDRQFKGECVSHQFSPP
jgi:hypothetical protein